MPNKFIDCLENKDIDGLKEIPKSDLHNHATRGGNIKYVIGDKDNISLEQSLPNKFSNLDEMQEWYNKTIKPYCTGKHGFVKRIEAAFMQAQNDGIKVLSMSFGIGDRIHFNGSLDDYIDEIKSIKDKIAPDIVFIPEICFGRTNNIKPIEEVFDEILSLTYFKSIDIVGDETLPVDNFKNIYRRARKNGFILKAHIGEFSSAESIRKTVEILELDQVQHGISAVESKEVMLWLANNNIQLNICPTSNVMLSRVRCYEKHPIGILYSYGIPVTINSDDMLIFNQSVSEEYMNLYNSGILSATELNYIREIGLGKYNIDK